MGDPGPIDAGRSARAPKPAFAAAALGLAALVACGEAGSGDRAGAALAGPGAGAAPEAASAAVPEAPRPVAVLDVAGFGEIRIELRPDEAPRTVENFVELARSGFYDGTTFHRVVPEFVIQGGDPNSRDRDPRNDGQGGPRRRIPDEPNPLRHERGAVSMANRGPNTGGSQFFVALRDLPHLDGRHTVFGRVVGGMEVVDRIAVVPTDLYGRHGPRERPLKNVLVETIQIEEPGEAPGGRPGVPETSMRGPAADGAPGPPSRDGPGRAPAPAAAGGSGP